MRKTKYWQTVLVLNLFFFISCFLTANIIAQTTNSKKVLSPIKYKLPFKTPDVIEEKLLGNVKSVKESHYNPERKFEKLYLGEPFKILIKNYNSDGYNTLWDQRISVEVETIEDVALCCPEGDPTAVGITIQNHKYDYAENLEVQEYKSGESLNFLSENIYKTRYEDGETTEFDAEGNIIAKITVKKGLNGVKTTTEYNQNGEINYRKTENGNDTTYDDGSIYRIKSYKNEKGNVKETWLKSLSLNMKIFTLLEKEIESETQKELRKTLISYVNGIENSRRVTVFDKTSNLEIEYFQIPKSGKKYHFKYEYEFDSVGNWTSKTSLSEVTKFGKTYFEAYLIIKRAIDYY
ncbi:MAG: hypothetical protein H0X49_05310 [Acidobacteria bacterium]|nr:hypothetical protein [Acidobacteriota bacterium]